MTLTPNNHTIEKEIRDLKRRISALERQQQDVGDLSEIAPNATFGDGAVTIDEDGISIIGGNQSDENELKFYDGSNNKLFRGSSYLLSSTDYGYWLLDSTDGNNAELAITATAPSGKTALLMLTAQNPNGASITISSEDTIDLGSPNGIKITTGGRGVLTGGEQAIADDDVYFFTPACARGIILIHAAVAGGEFFSILHYSAIAGTAIAYSMVSGSSTVVTTGSLSGTTGTDGKITISAHTDGKIYIENRRGGSTTVRWQILAGGVA